MTRTGEEFVAAVGEALGTGGPDPARSALVKGEGWEARVEEIRGHVAAAEAALRGNQAEPGSVTFG